MEQLTIDELVCIIRETKDYSIYNGFEQYMWALNLKEKRTALLEFCKKTIANIPW